MSEFIVSARKYRPASFEALLGQDTIARTLRNSIQRGQLAHAYLFCGPRGVGKTTTARIFAKMINCSNPGADMEPCGECESCLSFAEGRSYCIHELDAASNNGVEDIKGLIDQVRIPPQVGRYSVFIIDEVHMLSTQAFNAFLKTLEEPPAHAIFILATTEKHKILPTILSRCQTYDFNRISIEDMVLNLKGIAAKENINIDEESLHLIARKADGAMRDALTIFDQTVAFCGNEIRREDVVRNLNILDYEHCFALVDAFLEGNYAAALLKFDELLAKGFNALHFVSAISDHLRNLLVSRTAGLEALLDLPASLKQNYAEQAARCSVKFIYEALAITTQCESLYKSSINPRLHVEFALMRLSFLLNAAPAAAEAAAPAATKPAAETPAAPTPAAAPAETKPAETAPTAAPEATVAAATAPAVAPEAPAEEKAEKAEEKIAEAKEAEPAAAAESPARRTRRSGGPSISIKSLMSQKEETAAETAEKKRSEAPTEEEIREQWKLCAKLFEEKPRLANAILNSVLEFGQEEGQTVMTFLVANEAQAKWIRDKALSKLEAKLQELLDWKEISLRVDQNPESASSATPYSPEEKFQDIRERNPQVDSLIKSLDGKLN
ncbi:MAG: DNA polymerase III subunit gamma/tau [Bacteroidales bacterium]|nr:DNA polymerase III subunit gamma/tau [Bacteroidales bacterium]MDD6507968.1 DNA polymerase III subunit gamma/tau [Bacteroidales bacterium]